jgi:hypothetical protein
LNIISDTSLFVRASTMKLFHNLQHLDRFHDKRVKRVSNSMIDA